MRSAWLQLCVVIFMVHAVAAQDAAMNKAFELTEAIARGDVRAVQHVFDADVQIPASDVLTISRDVFFQQRPVLRVIGSRGVDRRSGQALFVCGESHARATTYPIAFIQQDERIVHLGIGKPTELEHSSPNTRRRDEPQRRTPDARRRGPYDRDEYDNKKLLDLLLKKPDEGSGVSLPVRVIEPTLHDRCSNPKLMSLRDVKYSDKSVAIVIIRLLAETPKGMLRVSVGMTWRGVALYWRTGDSPDDDDAADWRTGRGDRSNDILLEELRLRLKVVEGSGLSEFRSVRRYTVEGREYVDAAESRTAVANVKQVTLTGLRSTTYAALGVWVASEFDGVREPTTQQIQVKVDGRTELRTAFGADAVDDFQLFWQNMIGKLRNLPDMAPDITISSTPTQAGFTLRITSEPARNGTTNVTLKNVYRGLYTLDVIKPDHKSCTYEVDLVNDPRTKIVCTLAPGVQEGLSFCRQQ